VGSAGLRLLAAAGLVLVAAGLPGFSSATFTASTTAPAGVSAAADWTPPTVSMSPPGTVSGTVVVTASAQDQRSTVAAVTVQRSTGGSAWTVVCTDATAPYSCSWDTTTVADGGHQLRAIAVDSHGNTATSVVVDATVANAASVTLGPLAEVVSGSVPLSASVTAPASASVDLRIQYARAGTTTWVDVPGCTTTTRSASCMWQTGQLADLYDVRARAVVGSSTLVDVAAEVLVDNAPPTAGLVLTPGPWSGTVTLSATADDTHSGVDTVALEYAAVGSTTWTGLCTDSDEPFTCDWRTTSVPDGGYVVRAVATDLAGNTVVSKTEQRSVNNTVASVSVTSPGSPVGGTVTVGAEAASTRGVKNVAIRWAPAGGSTWTILCTDSTAPYSCPWNTLAATAGTGSFDLQAVLTDDTNATLTSARVTVVVDNSPLRAYDVQAVDVAGAGRLQAGDQLVLTYSTVVDPGTVVSGWNGTGSRTATVTLNQSGSKDTLAVTGANLGQVALLRNFTARTVTFAGTVSHAVSTTGGVGRSVVTVTLGTVSDATALRTVTGASNMVWTPSTAVRAPGGTACAATPVTETGVKDRDF
jgi:hypothetical protein